MRYIVSWMLACIPCTAAAAATAAPAAPTDIIVLFVDHWEPHSVGDTPADIQA